MKYLKLYEAFESIILSKTLKYLSKGSKDSFLKDVKQICDEMDFPYSKLSDEYFEYLPFNNALKKIDGDNKIYKFWLNSDGDLINTTLTDGEILKQKYTDGDSIGEDNDYVGVDKIYTIYGELNELEDRSKIIILFRGDSKPTLATLFEDSGDYFAIHDNRYYDGGHPDYHDYDEWSEYGEYSWSLRGTDFSKIQLAVHIDSVVNDVKEGEIDYYSYNKKYKPEHKKNGNSSSKKYLDGAEFAILLNTSKISNFQPKSKIQSTRKEIKSGAQALKNPEDIKKSNLERRLMEIAKKEFNINTFNELFNKVLFDKYILFFNLDDTIKSINQIIKLWEDPVDSAEDHMNSLIKWHNTLTNGTIPTKSEVETFFGDATTNNGRDRDKGAKLTLQHYGKINQDEIKSVIKMINNKLIPHELQPITVNLNISAIIIEDNKIIGFVDKYNQLKRFTTPIKIISRRKYIPLKELTEEETTEEEETTGPETITEPEITEEVETITEPEITEEEITEEEVPEEITKTLPSVTTIKGDDYIDLKEELEKAQEVEPKEIAEKIRCLEGEQFDVNEQRCLPCTHYGLVWDSQYKLCKQMLKEDIIEQKDDKIDIKTDKLKILFDTNDNIIGFLDDK